MYCSNIMLLCCNNIIIFIVCIKSYKSIYVLYILYIIYFISLYHIYQYCTYIRTCIYNNNINFRGNICMKHVCVIYIYIYIYERPFFGIIPTCEVLSHTMIIDD